MHWLLTRWTPRLSAWLARHRASLLLLRRSAGMRASRKELAPLRIGNSTTGGKQWLHATSR